MREAWYEKWVVQTNLFINDLFVVDVRFFVQIFKRTSEHRECYGSEVNSFFVINCVNYGPINLMRNRGRVSRAKKNQTLKNPY